MDEIKKQCSCGEDIVACEECGRTGCPECEAGWSDKWYRDESIWFCPECLAKMKQEYNEATKNGTEVCGSCSLFVNEDAEGEGWCEFHQEPRCCGDYCTDRLPK